MKTSILTIIIALSIPACVDHSAQSGANGKSDSATVIITQPRTPENISNVVDSLRESFTRVAVASNGAEVPNPHLSILTADGKTLDVPAPKLEGGFFGENTPKARQARLESHLKALADKLTTGCSAKVVPVQAVKTVVASAKGSAHYYVWAAGGGPNPWSSKDTNPPRFIEDRETFAGQLSDASTQNRHFLVLSDGTGIETATPKAKQDQPKIAKAKPTAANQTPNTPLSSGPKQAQVAAKGPPTPSTASSQPQHMIMQPGGSVIVNVGRDEDKNGSPSKSARIELPNDAERIGEPIRFEQGKSTPINKAELDRIAKELKRLKARFELRVVVTSRADIEKGSKPTRNQELSEQRADVCRAYMLESGIPIHQVICIGDALAESTAEQERQVCFYVIDKVERTIPDAAKTASN